MDAEFVGNLLSAIRDAASKPHSNDDDIALPVFDPDKNDCGAASWCDSIETLAKDFKWNSIRTAAKAGWMLNLLEIFSRRYGMLPPSHTQTTMTSHCQCSTRTRMTAEQLAGVTASRHLPKTSNGTASEQQQKQCFVTGAVCCNIVGQGCTLGYPGILLPQLKQPGSRVTLTTAGESWLAAVTGIMLLVGSFVAPPIMSRYGRKTAHIALTVPSLVGWFITILATNFEMHFIGRVLQGLAFGMLSPLRSVLIGEYTSPKNRGAFLTLIALAQAFGIFFVHLLGSLIDWQLTALVCVFFPFFSLIMTIYAPESPSWLASKRKYDKCREVFHWLRGHEEDDELEEMIHARILLEKAASMENRRKENLFKQAFTTVKKKEFYKPNILMIHAFCMVQFVGGTTMASYSTVIISLIVGPGANAHFWMIALDTQRIISNAIAVYIINKVKRRTMTFATGGLCVLSHLAIASYVYARNKGFLMYDAQWLPLLLINIQFFTVAVGMVPLPSIIAGEVFPLQYKSIGGTISTWSLSGFMFLVLKTFPALTNSIGIDGTYAVYAGIIMYNLAVIWVLLPETKGKTLQQIEDEFRGGKLEDDIEEKPVELDPVEKYRRRKSERRCSSPLLH